MNPNLKWKALFIVVVILGCVYGLIGLPTFPTSLAQIKDNFAHQIKLGLDLQGGTHLILQVQMQEAIAQETDQTVDRLTTPAARQKYSLRRNPPHRRHAHPGPQISTPTSSRISATSSARNYGNVWDLVARGRRTEQLHAHAARQCGRRKFEKQTMTQSIETIERRINALGLTEPTIQLRGGATTTKSSCSFPAKAIPLAPKP